MFSIAALVALEALGQILGPRLSTGFSVEDCASLAPAHINGFIATLHAANVIKKVPPPTGIGNSEVVAAYHLTDDATLEHDFGAFMCRPSSRSIFDPRASGNSGWTCCCRGRAIHFWLLTIATTHVARTHLERQGQSLSHRKPVALPVVPLVAGVGNVLVMVLTSLRRLARLQPLIKPLPTAPQSKEAVGLFLRLCGNLSRPTPKTP